MDLIKFCAGNHGVRCERSRTPPRRNYFDDVPRWLRLKRGGLVVPVVVGNDSGTNPFSENSFSRRHMEYISKCWLFHVLVHYG